LNEGDTLSGVERLKCKVFYPPHPPFDGAQRDRRALYLSNICALSPWTKSKGWSAGVLSHRTRASAVLNVTGLFLFWKVARCHP